MRVLLKQLNYPVSMLTILFKSIDCMVNDRLNDPWFPVEVVNLLIFTFLHFYIFTFLLAQSVVAKKTFN